MARILVVDDEEPIRELLKFNLEKEGYDVSLAADGIQALALTASLPPDLVVLDVMIPGINGMDVCRDLRQNPLFSHIPIIMLTAKGEEIDKVLGLELGADDYMTKPFSTRELIARIKARLRRRVEEPAGQNRLSIGDLLIDTERFLVLVNGQSMDLTPKEMELLKLLAANQGKVFSRDYLMERIWGYDFAGDTRTVDVHVRHLRQKIEQDPANPQFIETVRGVGYRFKQERLRR